LPGHSSISAKEGGEEGLRKLRMQNHDDLEASAQPKTRKKYLVRRRRLASKKDSTLKKNELHSVVNK